MKISKFIFILIAIILISALIIYYFFTNNYNLEKIIADIKKNYDVSVILNEDPEWSFNNEVALKFNAKINDKNEDFNSENMEFIFVQPYNISLVKVDIGTKSLNFRGLKIQLLKLNGKYSFLNKIFNLNKLSAKIGEGNINLQGKLNQSKENKFNLSGGFKNLYLNQIIRQLNFTDWKRLELKISSKDLSLNGKIDKEKSIFNDLNGRIPINGSMYFVTTEEERFGIAFLNLLIDQLPNYKNLSKSLSQIINNFSDAPAQINGSLNIINEKIETNDLFVINNENKIKIEGYYNMLNNFFDAKLFFFESENLIVEAIISGNIEDPKIQIINAKNLIEQNTINNDLKKVFNDGVSNFIEKLLDIEK